MQYAPFVVLLIGLDVSFLVFSSLCFKFAIAISTSSGMSKFAFLANFVRHI